MWQFLPVLQAGHDHSFSRVSELYFMVLPTFVTTIFTHFWNTLIYSSLYNIETFSCETYLSFSLNAFRHRIRLRQLGKDVYKRQAVL